MSSCGKIKSLINGGQIFFCPGCKKTHILNIFPKETKWNFNDDYVVPTFYPDIKITIKHYKDDDVIKETICHFYIVDGYIQFLEDSNHTLRGETVELPNWPYEEEMYRGIIE